MNKLVAGVDGGSVSIKLALLDENAKIIKTTYKRHYYRPLETTYEILKQTLIEYPNIKVVFTGSTGKLIATIMDAPYINELIAIQKATNKFYPTVKTVIEIGGEDSKLLILDKGVIKDFSLNSVCAAGTGCFLEQQAERLKLTIEEFSEMALKSKSPPRIAGRCSVFAKSDMIHLQQIATPIEDIVAGVCFAVARNFKGSLIKGRAILKDVSFQGGVALNKGVIRAFKEVLELDKLIIPEYTALMVAIGASLKAIEDSLAINVNLDKLKNAISSQMLENLSYEKAHKPLFMKEDDFKERHYNILFKNTLDLRNNKAYLGIDIGSISTNLAVVDEQGNILAKKYLMTAGRPIEAVREGLREIDKELKEKGNSCVIAGCGTTGSGRYMIADFVGADIVKNEITAQATAALFINSKVDTIFEIGGQDSKYISLRDGIIVDFEMNKACAAGTGSFLEEQAERLNISIKDEFASCAFKSKTPCKLGERCTVFIENSLLSYLQKGAKKEDLIAGLAYSIVENYINRVVAGKRIGEHIFFQGGTAFNKAVVAAFEKFLNKKITVPPNHEVTGAIGMALIAKDFMKQNPNIKTHFKGFDLAKKSYQLTSFVCKGCENMCEINRVKIEGEKDYLFYGGRCEKYDIRRKKSNLPDLFKFREEALWKSYKDWLENFKNSKIIPFRGKIGIPYVFFFHEYLPYWSKLLQELGFEVIISPKTNRHIINLGIETTVADTCFPVKVAFGHVRYLIEHGIESILIPSFINMNPPDDPYEKGHACPLTQSFPYQVKAVFKDIKVISPIVKLKEGKNFMIRQLKKVFNNISIMEIKKAVQCAEKAQKEFFNKIKIKGKEVLSNIDKITIAIVGRAYNALDMGVNLEIPKKLESLGVVAIPMDFLPEEDIYKDWPEMYWRSGQKILKAARIIKKYSKLFPIYIGNFSCGPDSFIHKYFEMEMEGKPCLHIEIDEHSADAGIITRCEAFLDSIEAQIKELRVHEVKKESFIPKRVNLIIEKNKKARTIYIPNMCDHAYAIESAFRFCGIKAEVLPESNSEAVDISKRYVSGKECYPCLVTTGDMLKKIFSNEFIPEKSAFFMPSGTGPCRFGQYNLFQRIVLKKIGIEVPIFSPVQDVSLYRDIGVVGNDFIKRAWQGMVAYDLLLKCLHETRPYEKIKGTTEQIYKDYIQKLREVISDPKGDIQKTLQQMVKDFSMIEKTKNKKPLIGIVGEIFVRSNRFSNENLIKKLENLGAEVYLSPVDEWLYYINYVSLRKALNRRDFYQVLQFLLKSYYQHKVAKRYEKIFNHILKTAQEPTTKEILQKALPYLHPSFEGEAVLSIGKAIDMIEKGVSGIVNAMPFGCMPGTVVTIIMRYISEKYEIPYISIAFDGTASTTNQLQLEAFMEQVKQVSQICSYKNG